MPGGDSGSAEKCFGEDAARAHTLRIKEQTRYTSDVRSEDGIDIAAITRARSLTLGLRVDTHIAPIHAIAAWRA